MATDAETRIDYSEQLVQLMQRVGIESYRSLSARAGVSRWAINGLRQGQVPRLRVEVLMRLSQVLETSISQLIDTFSGVSTSPTAKALAVNREPSLEALQREYERLQQRLVQQEGIVRQRMQGDAIAILESLLVQWPTFAQAAQQNPDLPATRLLPLMKPFDALLQAWNLIPIGMVGEEVPFDPQIHQPMKGNPQVGQLVRVRNVGYYHDDSLLYRARVSPLE